MHAHILAAQVENEQVGISVFILVSFSSHIRLSRDFVMPIEEKIDSCKRFNVLKVSWRVKLNVALSIESGAKRELWQETVEIVCDTKTDDLCVFKKINYCIHTFIILFLQLRGNGNKVALLWVLFLLHQLKQNFWGFWVFPMWMFASELLNEAASHM